MQVIQDLVDAATRDEAVLNNLRQDPSALARSLDLNSEHVTALRSAETIFATEKPILDGAD